jgi:hypothetical protein
MHMAIWALMIAIDIVKKDTGNGDWCLRVHGAPADRAFHWFQLLPKSFQLVVRFSEMPAAHRREARQSVPRGEREVLNLPHAKI